MPIKLLNDTTFERLMPSGDKVEIGDKNSLDFKPHLKLNRWECALGLGLDTVRKILPNVQPDKIIWDDGKIACEFIPQPPNKQAELGGFKFNIILKKKPKTNVSTLNFKAKGLKFYYQPALTPEEILAGAIRPDNVVGSYAVYHTTRTNVHRNKEDADKYKCGKAFHWYRPLIWDSSNPRTEVWGELNVDSAKGLRTVTIPQDFLDSAVYPVTIDDTFGYTTPGGSWITLDNYIRGSTYVGAVGTLDNVKAYVESLAGDHISKLGVYKDSDGVLVFGSGNIDSGWTEGTWITATAGSETLSAIDYNLVGWGGDGFQRVAYDTDTEEYIWYAKTFNSWPDPISFSSSAGWRFSIYCTYTPAAEAIIKVADEAIGVVESSLRRMSSFRFTPEAVEIGETALRLDHSNRVSSESLGIADSAIRRKWSIRLSSESLGITESLIRVAGFTKIITEAIGITEDFIRRSGFVKIITEAVSITETSVRKLKSIRITAETVSMIGTAVRRSWAIKMITEAVGIVDSLVRRLHSVRIKTEIISITDSGLTIIGEILVKMMTEVVAIADIAIRRARAVRIIDETISIAESFIKRWKRIIRRIRRPPAIYNLGRIKPTLYNSGRMLKKYTLGGGK